MDEEGDTIDESEFSPITDMFLDALRKYGAYLVDNSGGFTFYAEDIHTARLDLSDDEINALIGEPVNSGGRTCRPLCDSRNRATSKIFAVPLPTTH